jgi:hypothetical protein
VVVFGKPQQFTDQPAHADWLFGVNQERIVLI